MLRQPLVATLTKYKIGTRIFKTKPLLPKFLLDNQGFILTFVPFKKSRFKMLIEVVALVLKLKKVVVSLLLLLALPLFSFAQIKTILLKPERLKVAAKGFFIGEVIDTRKINNNNVGKVFNQKGERTIAALENTPARVFQVFLNRNFNPFQTDSLTAVTLVIKELNFNERLVSAKRIDGDLTLSLRFETYQNGQLVELTGGSSTNVYTRPVQQDEVLEQMLRQSLENQLKEFGRWYTQNNATFDKLARRVQVIFDDTPNIDADTIVHYASSRPLTWADFKGRPSILSRWAAQVFTSFGFEARSTIKNRVVELHVRVSVWLDKTISWGRPDSKNDYVLAHEQLHFDITQIIGQRFKKKVQNMLFSTDDYSSEIQYQYLEFYRDLAQLQQQYDAETNHGLDQAAQSRWSEKVKKELLVSGDK